LRQLISYHNVWWTVFYTCYHGISDYRQGSDW
jgi:hypothetical protein